MSTGFPGAIEKRAVKPAVHTEDPADYGIHEIVSSRLDPPLTTSASQADHVTHDSSELSPEAAARIAAIRPTGSTKRALMTHSKDGKLLSEKKLRRLEKNRLSARECRRRKREATENLEREINILEAENLRLRLQMQIGKEAEESRLREQEKLTQDIDQLLKSGASESEIHATLEEFKEKHADYGKSRRSAIEFHLSNIERLLTPTQTTQVAMLAFKGGGGEPDKCLGSLLPIASLLDTKPAAIERNGSTPQDEATPQNLDPKALFQYLVNYLEVTPAQAAALRDSRHVSKELDSCLDSALSVLKELKHRLAQIGDDLEAEFGFVREVLTPRQSAKFLVWVANNDACMHMLNELWDRVYPAAAPSPSNDSAKS